MQSVGDNFDVSVAFGSIVVPKVTIAFILSDDNSIDEEPSDYLLHLYLYKLDQLREMIEQEYNSNDVKWLSFKLSQDKRGYLTVIIILCYFEM